MLWILNWFVSSFVMACKEWQYTAWDASPQVEGGDPLISRLPLSTGQQVGRGKPCPQQWRQVLCKTDTCSSHTYGQVLSEHLALSGVKFFTSRAGMCGAPEAVSLMWWYHFYVMSLWQSLPPPHGTPPKSPWWGEAGNWQPSIQKWQALW